MTLLDGAFQEAAKLAGAQLLEPVMAVKVVTPEERRGTIIGDLHERGTPRTDTRIAANPQCVAPCEKPECSPAFVRK